MRLGFTTGVSSQVIAHMTRRGLGDPLAVYNLYLPFASQTPTYRSGSTTSANETTLPGRSYERSNGGSASKRELLSSGAPSALLAGGANGVAVPGIIPGVGYWARDTRTNLLFNAGSATPWTGSQTINVTTPGATFSFYGTGTMTLTAGTAVWTGGTQLVGVSDNARVVLPITVTTGGTITVSVTGNVTYACAYGNAKMSDGGPIIPTAGSTASIGREVLSYAATQGEGDFLFWIELDKLDTSLITGETPLACFVNGTNVTHYMYISGQHVMVMTNVPGGVGVNGTFQNPGRGIFAVRRLAGIWKLFGLNADGMSSTPGSGVGEFPGNATGAGTAPSWTSIRIGVNPFNNQFPNAPIRGAYLKTFAASEIDTDTKVYGILKGIAGATQTWPATVSAPNPLSATEDALITQNGINTVKYMGGSTGGEGLAAFFGAGSWPTGQGQLGTDYGAKTATSRTTVSGDPVYVAPGATLLEAKEVNGRIEVTNVIDPVTIRDSVVNSSSLRPHWGIYRPNLTATNLITVEDCTLYGAGGQILSIPKAIIRRCYLYDAHGDAMKVHSDTLVDQVYARLLGQSVGAHGDGIQTLGASNVTIIRSTFYMPAVDGSYYESGEGLTNCLRLTADGEGTVLENVLVAGNVLLGANESLHLGVGGANASSKTVQNVCVVNNRFGGVEYHGTTGRPVGFGPLSGNPGFNRKNILFSGNKMQDGSALKYGGTELDGIWNFDKSAMDARFRYIGEKVGFLDSNGDIKPGWSKG